MSKRIDPLLRFMNKWEEDPETGCWLWFGAKNSKGYGDFWNGETHGGSHVWAYEYFFGSVPEGLELDHLCRTLACCYPPHLEPVTHQENVLRGNAAKPKPYLKKTHCSQGHEYTEENSYIRPDGKGRNCVECVRTRSREYARRKRAAQ